MKKLIGGLLIFFFVILSIGHWAFHFPFVTVQLARWGLERSLPGSHVRELSVAGHRFEWPGRFVWSGIKLVMDYQGKTLRLSVRHAVVSKADSLRKDGSELSLVVRGAQADWDLAAVQSVDADITLKFQGRKLTRMEGPVRMASAGWDKLRAAPVSFLLQKDDRWFSGMDIHAQAYGGMIDGIFHWSLDQRTYSADLTLAGIDTALMSDWNDQIAAQVQGRINGHVMISGRGQELVSLSGDVALPDGAKVNAALLSMLAQYIPASQEKKRLEDLIKTGARLPVEVLSLTIKSETPQHLAGEITLKSREVNLELHLTNDIHTDGTLTSLIDHWRRK